MYPDITAFIQVKDPGPFSQPWCTVFIFDGWMCFWVIFLTSWWKKLPLWEDLLLFVHMKYSLLQNKCTGCSFVWLGPQTNTSFSHFVRNTNTAEIMVHVWPPPAITLKLYLSMMNEASYLCLETYVLILDHSLFSQPEQLLEVCEAETFESCRKIPQTGALIQETIQRSSPLSLFVSHG